MLMLVTQAQPMNNAPKFGMAHEPIASTKSFQSSHTIPGKSTMLLGRKINSAGQQIIWPKPRPSTQSERLTLVPVAYKAHQPRFLDI